ncbi:MAG: pirin family protein [Alphaproteobacteria bacterium]
MIEPRPFAGLGGADHGWLRARHHFSFAGYSNPARMGWGRLRVWNDDEIAPGTGFDPHPHRDMEIVTYVRDGAITHRDHLGNEGRTVAGDVQVMSAGTGIVHAEYNLEPVATRIFQLWIQTDRRGAAPSWGTRRFPRAARGQGFVVLASGRPAEVEGGALAINADAAVLAATLQAGASLRHALAPGRLAYLVVARGEARVNGIALGARAGAPHYGEAVLALEAGAEAELVMVDVAPA